MTIVTTPSVGMKFDSLNEACKFWAAYSKEKGFGVRKQYTNKRKDGSIRSFRFVCCKEGHRTKNPKSLLVKNPKAETRTDCEARIALRRKDEKFVIHEFIEAHNHPLQLPETTHMLASHRKISEVQAYEIEMAEDSGLMQKASFQLMSAHVGGRANLGYTRLDAKNYLKERRKRRMLFGEVGSLILSCNIFKSRFWKIHHFTMHIKWIVTSNLEHPAYVLSQTTENQFTFTELLMESLVDK